MNVFPENLLHLSKTPVNHRTNNWNIHVLFCRGIWVNKEMVFFYSEKQPETALSYLMNVDVFRARCAIGSSEREKVRGGGRGAADRPVQTFRHVNHRGRLLPELNLDFFNGVSCFSYSLLLVSTAEEPR